MILDITISEILIEGQEIMIKKILYILINRYSIEGMEIMFKKILIFIIIIAIIGGGFFYIQAKRTKSTQGNLVSVQTIAAEHQNISTIVTADGTAQAKDVKDIKARATGEIIVWNIEIGDQVKEGDVLFKLENETFETSLETEQMNLLIEEKNYEKLLNTYNQQDEKNELKLEESRGNVEINKLSLKNEKITRENQKTAATKKVDNAKTTMEKARETMESKKHLYDNSAISRNEFEAAEENYNQAVLAYDNAQDELETLATKTIPAALKIAEYKVQNAEHQLKMLEKSIAENLVTEKDLVLAKMKIENVNKNIETIRKKITKLITYAPLTGTIIAVDAKAGDRVLEDSKTAQIADLSQLIVEAWIDEVHINKVAVGQSVKIFNDAIKDHLTGRIESIAPVAVIRNNVPKFAVKIEIDNSENQLRSGMLINAEIITDSRDSVIAVQPLALMGEEDKFVYIYKDGIVEKRPVQTGLRSLTLVEIIGVELGEKIIVGPYQIIKNLEPGIAVMERDNNL